MQHFTAHRLMIRATIVEPVLLNQHKGSALRGALYHSLRNRFCTMRPKRLECPACPLWQVCPVCTLVSTLAPANPRGRDVARPYTIQPPLDGTKTFYEPGESFQFGLTLYAQALQLFPYVIMALYSLEEEGLGRRVEANRWRRGTFRVEEVWAENPLTRQRQAVTRPGDQTVEVPDVPITHQQVTAWASRGDWSAAVTLELLTPLRLTARGRLVKPGWVTFRVFMARLLDRLESLAQHFGEEPLKLDFAALLRSAEAVRTLDDATRWVELRSYSTRQRRATPIGGLVGKVTFAADDWAPFLPWLIWGRFTHLGKDAVKGNGWYRLVGAALSPPKGVGPPLQG